MPDNKPDKPVPVAEEQAEERWIQTTSYKVKMDKTWKATQAIHRELTLIQDVPMQDVYDMANTAFVITKQELDRLELKALVAAGKSPTLSTEVEVKMSTLVKARASKKRSNEQKVLKQATELHAQTVPTLGDEALEDQIERLLEEQKRRAKVAS